VNNSWRWKLLGDACVSPDMTRRKIKIIRVVTGMLAAIGVTAALALAGRSLAAVAAPIGIGGSALLGAAAMVLASSVVEWLVHGRLMHRRSGLPLVHLAYDLHHRAHHWTHYPPDRYVQDEVTYVPLVPPRPERACTTPGETTLAALGQALFYTSFLLPIVAIAWMVTANGAFVVAGGIVGTAVVGLAVHVHDAVHCPGHSPLERFRWFWALDRHHYLHHIDTRANVNFLLPLGDLVFGTLRTKMSPAEAARWPSYAAARANVLPSCRRSPRARKVARAAAPAQGDFVRFSTAFFPELENKRR
jgi:sterol desaturase/sphingolipid hydroxylase (fatty acid hydroxylase superfamily)